MARKKSAADASGSSISRAIRQCVDSGKVEFGSNRGIKRSLAGKAKLVIISKNCPESIAQDIISFCKLSSIPLLRFEGTSIDLGTVAGKPYPVSVLAVIDPGNSGIVELAKSG